MEEQTNKIYENSGYNNKKNDVQQNNVPPKDYKTLAIITTILSSFLLQYARIDFRWFCHLFCQPSIKRICTRKLL